MKIITNNSYFEVNNFKVFEEANTVFEGQKSINKAVLKDTFGQNHQILNIYDSLTSKRLLSIKFSTDKPFDDLICLYWAKFDRIVLETDKLIYMLSTNGKIIANVETYAPILGLSIVNQGLLLLEEVSVKIINQEGVILRNIPTDIIVNYSLDNDNLKITTIEDNEFEIRLLNK